MNAFTLLTHGVRLVKRYWIALSVFNIFLVSALSLTPLEHLPVAPGSDKLHHFIAYACVIFPCALVRPKYWTAAVLLVIAWGGVIELIQPFVNRYGEWLDVAANTLGIFIGILSATLTNYLIRRKKFSS